MEHALRTPQTGDAIGRVNAIGRTLSPLRALIVGHPLFERLAEIETLRVFVEHHVYAVWDFMSLLKRLQQDLAPATVPWCPPIDVESARLVNEIVLGEESDVLPGGGHGSHYALYLEAMRDLGARTDPILEFVASIRAGVPCQTAMARARVPPGAQQFVHGTISMCQHGTTEEVAGAFVFGREDVIPGMFTELVGRVGLLGAEVGLLQYYFDRHIDVDAGEHGPMARKLIARLCGDDVLRWRRAQDAAASALQAREALWDSVLIALESR